MLIIGYLASLNQERYHTEFPSSCTLMELDMIGETPRTEINFNEITGEDGLVYSMRRLLIKLEFRTELFIKIEQIKDYSGK